ncbi:MAG: hypothetical protein ACOY95_02465 [Pseudomonadota bacterium]
MLFRTFAVHITLGIAMRVLPFAFALLAISAALLSACDVKLGYFEKDRAAALSSMEKLHALYNEGKNDQLYDLGSPALQQAITLEQFKASIANTRVQAGRQITSKLIASSCFPNEVRLVYHSQFEAGLFTESVMWAIPGDTARLVMYQISPGHIPTDKQAQKGCPT